MERLNPYEAPMEVARPAPGDRQSPARPMLHVIVRLQTVGVIGLTLMSLADSRTYGEFPPWLTVTAGLAFALPIAVAAALTLLGPILWLGMLGAALLDQRPAWWFVALEPLLWGATLFAMLPAVQ